MSHYHDERIQQYMKENPVKTLKKGTRLSQALRDTIAKAVVEENNMKEFILLELDREEATNQIIDVLKMEYTFHDDPDAKPGLLPVFHAITIDEFSDEPFLFSLHTPRCMPDIMKHGADKFINPVFGGALYNKIVNIVCRERALNDFSATQIDKLLTYLGGFTSLKDLLAQSPELEQFVPNDNFVEYHGVSIDQILAA